MKHKYIIIIQGYTVIDQPSQEAVDLLSHVTLALPCITPYPNSIDSSEFYLTMVDQRDRHLCND